MPQPRRSVLLIVLAAVGLPLLLCIGAGVARFVYRRVSGQADVEDILEAADRADAMKAVEAEVREGARKERQAQQREKEERKLFARTLEQSELRPLVTAVEMRGPQLTLQMTDGFRALPKEARQQIAHRLLITWKASLVGHPQDAQLRLLAITGERIGGTTFFGHRIEVED